VSKRGNAQKSAAEGQAAQTNLQVSGGADNSQAKNASFYNRALQSNQLYEGTGIKDDPQGREIAKSILPESVSMPSRAPAPAGRSRAARLHFIDPALRVRRGYLEQRVRQPAQDLLPATGR
jgi:hypothetical protein